MNAVARAWLKSASAAAAGAAAGVFTTSDFAFDQAHLAKAAALAIGAVLLLWSHSPGTAIKAEAANPPAP